MELDRSLEESTSSPIFRTILQNKWEGICWLILGDIKKYNMTPFDIINEACHSRSFSLAYRLMTKFSSDVNFCQSLLKLQPQPQQQQDKSTGTLLHTLCSLKIAKHDIETVLKIIEKLFECILNSSISESPTSKSTNSGSEVFSAKAKMFNEFLVRKDKAGGATAIHYACHLHNFEIIDFILNYLVTSPISLITPQSVLTAQHDQVHQTPFALLFWQCGRIKYTNDILNKIKFYTQEYLKKVTNIEASSKAYFPVNSNVDFVLKQNGNYLNE
jgi:hypothetical protein